jgi:hypothetical protein
MDLPDVRAGHTHDFLDPNATLPNLNYS